MAEHTKSTTLEVDTGGGFTTIAECTSFQGPGSEKNRIDATHLGSTQKEYLAGLSDPGEFTVDIQYIPGNATHQSLTTLDTNGNTATWKVTFSGGETIQFDGYVNQFQPNIQTDDKKQASVTITLTTAITWPT